MESIFNKVCLFFFKLIVYFLHLAYQMLPNKMSPSKTVISISARKTSQFVCARSKSNVVILHSTNNLYDFSPENFPYFFYFLTFMTLFHVVHLYY